MQVIGEVAKDERLNICLNRFYYDVTAAIGASLLVSPFIAPIDVAVACTASGKSTIINTLRSVGTTIITSPQTFFMDKPFLRVYSLYAGTYAANNTIDTICKIYEINDVIPKLLGVTAVNMCLSLLRDTTFAQLFGKKAPTRVPNISYCIWLCRDVIAMAGAFILPQHFCKLLMKYSSEPKPQLEKTSQFMCPILIQVFNLITHLFGYDFYNNSKSKFRNRCSRIAKTYLKALPLRCFRIGTAYGIGGINNKKLRSRHNTFKNSKIYNL